MKVVLALIKAGANANAVDKSGLTPLQMAERDKMPEVVLELIKVGASVNAATGSDSMDI